MLTNHYKIPDLFISAAEQLQSQYNSGDCDISVTTLTSPPMIDCLRREHEPQEDIQDKAPILLGQSMHYLVECAAKREPGRYLSEERYTVEVDGWKVSGQFDVLDCHTNTLADVKVSKMTTFKHGTKLEYLAQLNMLAYMLRENGFTIDRIENWVVHADHSKMKAFYNEGYEQQSIKTYPAEMWTTARTLAYMSERIALHKAAREQGPEICSREERWQSPDSTEYCVQKPGASRASKIKSTMEEAIEAKNAYKKPEDYEIVPRENKSEPVRCKMYCSVSHACPFAKEMFELEIAEMGK